MIYWKTSYYGWWDAYTEKDKKLKVPSVTAVVNMKPDPDMDKFIEEVGEEAAERIMKLAAARGTVLHKFMENYYLAFAAKGDIEKALLYTQKKTLIDIQKEKEVIEEAQIRTGRNMFYSLLNAFRPNSDNPEVHTVLGLEHKIANFTMPYRGQYDINYLWQNANKLNNVITDYKSSSSLVEKGSVKESKYKLQLSGYWKAYELITGNELDYAKLWIAIKNSDVCQEIIIDRHEIEDLYAEFTELCTAYHTANRQKIEMFKDYKILSKVK